MKSFLSFLAVPALLLSSVPALAGFNVCNYSSRNVDVAFAFMHPEQPGNWVSAGWKTILSSQCQNLINYDLTRMNSRIYWYAVDSTNTGVNWSGPSNFCIKRGQPFTIMNADRNCGAGEWQGFRMTNVVGKANYTQEIRD